MTCCKAPVWGPSGSDISGRVQSVCNIKDECSVSSFVLLLQC